MQRHLVVRLASGLIGLTALGAAAATAPAAPAGAQAVAPAPPGLAPMTMEAGTGQDGVPLVRMTFAKRAESPAAR